MNWNYAGNHWAVDLLRGHIVQRRVRHAYLFTGPAGVGRRTLALRFAQALTCSAPLSPGEACQVCKDCQQWERMQHPDLSLIQPEQEGSSIKVEQVRFMQRALSLAPYQASHRVALLLNFENATASAANALLKTLEEPPSKVVLLLTAESPESLLPTIASRCEVLRLRPLAVDEIQADLQSFGDIPASQADTLAHLSGGRLGVALTLYQQPDILSEQQAWLDDLIRLLQSSRVERFAYAKQVSRKKRRLRKVVQVWLSFLRDVLLRIVGEDYLVIHQDRLPEISYLSEALSLFEARQAVFSCQQSLQMLEQNVNTLLTAEVLLLEMPFVNS